MQDLIAIATDNENPLSLRIESALSLCKKADELYRALCSENRKIKDSDNLIKEYIANNGIAKFDSDVTGLKPVVSNIEPEIHSTKKKAIERKKKLTDRENRPIKKTREKREAFVL